MDLDRITDLGFEKFPGWMNIIMVSFSVWWNILIVLQCYCIFLLVTSAAAYRLTSNKYEFVRYVLDTFYMFDVTCMIIYRTSPSLRKLRSPKGRGWFFILLDVVSVIPLEQVYTFIVMVEEKSAKTANLFLQNRVLRLYRIFQLEYFYGTTARKASQCALLLFLQIASKSIMVAHILCCVWVYLRYSADFAENKFHYSVWHETNMAVLVIHNWSGKKETFRESWERLLVAAAILSGFLLIYAHFYPSVLYVAMQLNTQSALYYEKYEKFRRFLRNTVHGRELREKLQNYFDDFWKAEKDYAAANELLSNIPLSLKKAIFTDIYWEALRHSELFRETSTNFKRSLSLRMKTEYYRDGDVIYRKGQEKTKMMFLVHGIVQIMAEENEEASVLSFSGGTVFGELSLFLRTPSQVIVKCKSYCELQIITLQEVSRVLRDYPKDNKIIVEKLNQRYATARYAQWRKKTYGPDEDKQAGIFGSDSFVANVNDCVKWIKKQWGAIWQEQKRHNEVVKAIEEGFRLSAWLRPVRPQVKIGFVSNYLDLIVLTDDLKEKKDAVCLNTAFPWSIDPSTPFLVLWHYFVFVLAVVPAILYPLCTTWLPEFPWPAYIFTFFVTCIFQVDVTLKLLTAIKTKENIITRFSGTFFRRIQQPTFYLDVLAALPYQLYIIINFEFNRDNSRTVGLILHPAILKSYVFFVVRVPSGNYMDKLTLCKNCVIYFLLVYWLAEFIQLSKYWLGEKRWFWRFIDSISDVDPKDLGLWDSLASVCRAVVTAAGIPDFYMYPETIVGMISVCVAKYFFFFFFCFFFGSFYASHTIKIFAEETFRVLLSRIKSFLRSIYISPNVEARLLRTVMFQWQYDMADYLSSKVSINKSIPFELKKKIYSTTTYRTLHSCRMFQEESAEFIVEVMERSFLVAVPSGSVLVTCGHTSHAISIIHQGYCQMNSFVPGDVTAGLGYPVVLGPCTMFPLLSTFCYVPAPISVVTLTDCEVIMIDLNDLLNIMIRYDFFKDLIDVVKESKLWTKVQHVPALMRFIVNATPPKARKELYRKAFRRLGCCGKLMRFLCPKENFVGMKFLKVWEGFYAIYLTLLFLIWPCCFGLLLYVSHVLVPVLIVGKSIVLTHIVLHFFSPYYNKEGLLVTHPIRTAFNYLTTGFVSDFICIFPAYAIYLYGIADPYAKPNLWMVLLNMTQIYVKIIYVMGYVRDFQSVIKNRHAVRNVKIILVTILFFNLIVNMFMYLSADWIFGGPYKVVGFTVKNGYGPSNLIRKNSLVDYYVFVAYWVLSSLTTTDYLLHKPAGTQLCYAYVQGFVGTIINFYIYVWLSSTSVFANIGGTIFQEKITSFVEYLKKEKTDDKLIEYAISHYNHEWLCTQGESLRKIFERLPLHLHEELVYPLYRGTLIKNEVFSRADEGFFKILSTRVTNVYFNRGSVIMFQKESQSDIYIVHKGKCFVYDWFLTLEQGSILGDIRHTGLMENQIYALTHVEMLKISSTDFFTIVNSFDDLEGEWMYKAKNAQNFLKAETSRTGFQQRPVDSRDVLQAFGLQKKGIGFEDESYFEDPENSSRHLLKYKQEETSRKKRILIIYPESWMMKVHTVMSLATTFFTLLAMPTLHSFGALTVGAFVITAVLDFFWLLSILGNFRMSYIDKRKGNVITDGKFIAKAYARRPDGLLVDLLGLIPFELIPVAVAMSVKRANHETVSCLRFLRLFRGKYFLQMFRRESNKMSGHTYVKFLYIILFTLFLFTALVNTYIPLATESSIVKARNPHKLSSDQFFAFVLALDYVINSVSSSNLCVIIPDTLSQIFFFNVIAFLFPYVKGWIIKNALSILYFNGVATAFFKSQTTALESYLANNDTSPSIIKEVLDYEYNLLQYSRSESMPTFLTKAPINLRITIMRDVYMQHLANCPLFRGVERIFLDQLLARAVIEIFFPGQQIVEVGDVDHRMYFIHTGEVHVLSYMKERKHVEYVVGRLGPGRYFGEAQGLWYGLPHRNSFRARTLVKMVILNSDEWMDLRRNFPEIATQIRTQAKTLQII